MSATESKKAKKRKSRKTAKPTSPNVGATRNGQQMSQTAANSEVELAALQKLMDAEELDASASALAAASGSFLGRERCLLCRCERPDPPLPKNDTTEGEDGKSSSLSQIPLWVCPACRKTVEEEEKRAQADRSDTVLYQDSELRLDPPNLFSDVGQTLSTSGTQCTCEACTERRQIEAEHEKETRELQQCWIELRHVVRCAYREAGTGLGHTEGSTEAPVTTIVSSTTSPALPDTNKMKELVHRLCTRDPHQLYQRLESQGREYVIEMKVRLLKQLSAGHKTPPQARQFVTLLLEEFSNLCTAAKTLSSFLSELETEHLQQFKLTWELHNKHLFQSIIYADPVVQNALPMLITQLRLGATSKEVYHEDTYPNTLHPYLRFDDEMADVSVKWRESHQLLEKYNEEQAALKAKQRMLKEDWEFFKAQRKMLEQKVLKGKSGSGLSHTNSHTFELQFTETMRHIFQGTKPSMEECHCPNCNHKRCPCDECTISHMITCGIISQDLNTEGHSPLTFSSETSPYIIDVTPPSMSSTSSSSGSSSPLTLHPERLDPDRLELPFEDCPENFEMAEDEIPEEIEGDSQSGDSEEEEEEEEEDDEESGDDEDEEEEEEEEEEERKIPGAAGTEAEATSTLLGLNTLGGVGQMDSVSLSLSDTATAPQNCDCTHCLQAKLDQSLVVVEEPAASQCQCHACLQQSGQGVVTSLPQQLPAAPRPSSLHLYPHIHGSLPAAPHATGVPAHARPLLQPHLYELHNPLRGLHPPTQPGKKPAAFSLDLDTHEALNEHIYHAFGEWDNRLSLAAAHKFGTGGVGAGGGGGSELFNTPPPPLISGSAFSTDAFDKPGGTAASVTHTRSSMPSMTTSASSTGGGQEHIHTDACFKNFKQPSRSLLTTSQASPPRNKTTTIAGGGVAGVAGGVPASTTPVLTTSHSDQCLKHNPFLHTHHSSFTSTAGHPPSPNVPLLHPPGVGVGGMVPGAGASNGDSRVKDLPHTCSHHGGQAPNLLDHNQPVAPPGSGNMNSVGTSTVCNDPECEGHHGDDHYDDDSCSEQSSSTSTSNQKDGKYCDCCYCEFFGHSNPPVAPTSRNYAEMRDRLRLRLKKKQNEMRMEPKEPEKAETPQQQKILDKRGLDDLIRFINGDGGGEAKDKDGKPLSAKAAKRARQKQRKLEEAARQQAELEAQRIRQLEAQRAREAEEAKRAEAEAAQRKQQQRKRKGKHKEEKQQQQSQATSQTKNLNNNNQPVTNNSSVAASVDVSAKNQKNQKGCGQPDVLPRSNNATPTKVEEKPRKNKSLSSSTSTQNHSQSSASTSPHPASNNKSSATHNYTTSASSSSSTNNPSTRNATEKPKQQQVSSRPQATASPSTQKLNATHSTSMPKTNTQTTHPIKPATITNNMKTSMPANVRPAAQNLPQGGSTACTNNNNQSRRKANRKPVQQQVLTSNGHPQTPSPTHDVDPASMANVPRPTPLGHAPYPPRDKAQDTIVNGSHHVNHHHNNKVAPGKTPILGKVSTQKENDRNRVEEKSPRNGEQAPNSGGRGKKKRKNKAVEDLDEIFMPKEVDPEAGDMDEFEREIEEFKRFCLDSTPKREKVQVNVNLKDIFSKKKSGVSCA